MQEKQPMSEVIKETIDKVKSIADTKTVIGDPITLIEGVTILPVSRVSVGAALGGGEYGAKKDRRKEQTEKVVTDNFGGGGGTAVTVTPVAFWSSRRTAKRDCSISAKIPAISATPCWEP